VEEAKSKQNSQNKTRNVLQR